MARHAVPPSLMPTLPMSMSFPSRYLVPSYASPASTSHALSQRSKSINVCNFPHSKAILTHPRTHPCLFRVHARKHAAGRRVMPMNTRVPTSIH